MILKTLFLKVKLSMIIRSSVSCECTYINMPENKNQNRLNDLEYTKKVISEMGLKVIPIKVLRIGIQSNRPRPLKVIFP